MDGAHTAAAGAAASGATAPQLDDWSSLLLHHQAKVLSLQPEADRTKALAKAATDAVNAAIEIGATELGVTNEVFKAWLAKKKVGVVDFAKEHSLDQAAYRAMGKMVQGELDLSRRDAATNLALLHYEGYDDGVNGRDCRTDLTGDDLQTYLGGRNAGTAVLAMGLAKGKAVSEAQGQVKTTPPANLNPGDEDDEDDEEKIAAAASRLSNDSEFMARSGGESGEGDGGSAGADKGDAGTEAAKPKSRKRADVH